MELMKRIASVVLGSVLLLDLFTIFSAGSEFWAVFTLAFLFLFKDRLEVEMGWRGFVLLNVTLVAPCYFLDLGSGIFHMVFSSYVVTMAVRSYQSDRKQTLRMR